MSQIRRSTGHTPSPDRRPPLRARIIVLRIPIPPPAHHTLAHYNLLRSYPGSSEPNSPTEIGGVSELRCIWGWGDLVCQLVSDRRVLYYMVSVSPPMRLPRPRRSDHAVLDLSSGMCAHGRSGRRLGSPSVPAPAPFGGASCA